MQTFPYSRHSSYEELCFLIEAFKPKDIWPCTVDKINWSAAQSMSFLFGHLYNAPCKFTHDQAMFRKNGGDAGVVPWPENGAPEDHTEPSAEKVMSHERGACSSSSNLSLPNPPHAEMAHARLRDRPELAHDRDTAPVVSDPDHTTKKRRRSDNPPRSENRSENRVLSAQAECNTANISSRPSTGLQVSSVAPHAEPPSLSPYEYSEAWKQQAFEAAQGTGSNNWNDITLVSVCGHQRREEEL